MSDLARPRLHRTLPIIASNCIIIWREFFTKEIIRDPANPLLGLKIRLIKQFNAWLLYNSANVTGKLFFYNQIHWFYQQIANLSNSCGVV